ncbi:DNA translocase FtsK [Salinisphaera sp. G21_0]|uniref:DNA translocase FtsK n=1 Tax=Salinisphaera sp. G21_0 TaxID=2821094 RepID=UPI001ADB7450|nr:DNA translocase FtsK [Salinisphaera sp. G21_0]MBO9481695.1 DNA translocase FtsK 4TM domain-containing protein [Salinisphaera sp. G21_0]
MAGSASKKSHQPDSDQSQDPVFIRRRKRTIRGDAATETLSSRVREGIMFGWLVLAAFLVLALASYDKVDPGWSHIGPVKDIANSAGRIGAWSADLLLTLFGFLAWMVPVILVIKAIRVFRYRHEPDEWNSWLLLIRSMGFILSIASGAALASLHYHGLSELFPSSSGGIIGELLIQLFLPAFNVTGSTLLLMALFLLGVTLYTDLSWFRLMDSVGYWSLRFAVYCKEKLLALYFALQEKLAARKQSQPEQSDLSPVKKQEPALKLQEDSIPLAPPVIEKRADKPKPVIVPPPAREKAPPLVEHTPLGSLPTASLLDEARPSGKAMSPESLDAMSRLLELKLKDFSVDVEVVAVHPGPVITRFEIQPAPGTKASKITNLASDLARSLAVVSVRVVEVIPGKSVMGIEIPNDDRETVFYSEIISSRAFDDAQSPVSLALGHDISGQPVIVDLAKMPHLLVAGTTGSGKSVGINAMILSMLFKSSPEDVRLIMIDPKMLELSIYDGIPHLLAPVVTDMKEAANALRWCVAEMERRYKLMAYLGVRNIAGYNRKVKDALEKGEPHRDPFYQPVSAEDVAPELGTLPFIVVVVDEFADMMMIVGKKVEELIARIAQKARAAGIHLILATQRPSVDVITGLIKANVPTRISFQVSSKIDSRTIIDQGGAEQLLGHGDMLYLPPGTSVPVRIHGAFVADDEVHRVVADWQLRGTPDFVEEILNGVSESSEGSAFSGGLDNNEQDPLYDEAVAFVTESRRASISSVQRQLKVGYNRAARMIEAMEAAGVVSPALTNGNREVIAPPPPKH